jgi:hypothetical protein
MQKLLILITFLSLMMASVAHAKWTEVAKNVVGGGTSYIDLERIKKHSGRVYYWMLGDGLKPNKYGVISFKVYSEAECGRFRFRNLSLTFYKGPMASGTIQSSIKIPEKEWRYPPPNSSSEIIRKAVCNHKP